MYRAYLVLLPKMAPSLGQNPHPAFGENPYLQLSDGSTGWLGFLIVSLAWAYSWTGSGTSKVSAPHERCKDTFGIRSSSSFAEIFVLLPSCDPASGMSTTEAYHDPDMNLDHLPLWTFFEKEAISSLHESRLADASRRYAQEL